MSATYQKRGHNGTQSTTIITGQQQIAEAKAKLEKGKAEIQKIAGSLVSADELIRFTLNACIKNPKLFECFNTVEGTASVFLSIITSRIIEIPCDGIHGYLVPFYDSKKEAMICQFMPGYKGFAQLAYHNPNIASVNCSAVYENDQFDFEYGTEAYLRHKPTNGPRGDLTWAYAIFKTKNGDSEFRVLTKEDVLKRKNVSKSRDSGPWRDWEPEMWAKTAFLFLAKVAPLGTKVARAAAVDDRIQTHGNLTTEQLQIVAKDEPAALGYEHQEPAFDAPRDDRRPVENTKPRSRSESPPKQSQRAELTPQVIVDRIEAAKSDADLNTIIDELNAMQTTGPLLFDECVQLIEMANSRRNSLQ